MSSPAKRVLDMSVKEFIRKKDRLMPDLNNFLNSFMDKVEFCELCNCGIINKYYERHIKTKKHMMNINKNNK